MMKLIYYKLNLEVGLYAEKLNTLVIENPLELDDFVLALEERREKISSGLEIFNGSDKMDFNKVSAVLFSPLDCKYEKKEIQKKLFVNLMEEIKNSEKIEEFMDLCTAFFELLDSLKFSTDYELNFDEDFGMNSLLKSFDVYLQPPKGNFVERFMEYSSSIQSLLGTRVFILVSCMQYMTETDLKHLQVFAAYRSINILFIESKQKALNILINEYIIDDDLCELH